jgi:hypothetical protein
VHKTSISNPHIWRNPQVREFVPRLRAQEISNYLETNEARTWLAFSRFDEVAVLISATHTRNPINNAWGVRLKPLQVVDLYFRESDDYFYGQRFKLIMACVAPVDDTYVGDIVKEVWLRHTLFCGGWLKWTTEAKRQAQFELYEAAFHYLGDTDESFHPYALHVGKAIEGETFGKGKILEGLEVHVERTKGGINVPQVRRGSVPVPVQDGRDRGA